MKRIYKKERGFTLIEVVASLTILSVIILGIYQLIIFTNETAVSNNGQLVAIHLAKAKLEQVKNRPEDFFEEPLPGKESPIGEEEVVTYTVEKCNQEAIENGSKFCDQINDHFFKTTIELSQKDDDLFEKQLVDAKIIVEKVDENIKDHLEGYVNYEDN